MKYSLDIQIKGYDGQPVREPVFDSLGAVVRNQDGSVVVTEPITLKDLIRTAHTKFPPNIKTLTQAEKTSEIGYIIYALDAEAVEFTSEQVAFVREMAKTVFLTAPLYLSEINRIMEHEYS